MEPTLEDFIKASLAGNAIPKDHAPTVSLDGQGRLSTINTDSGVRKSIRVVPRPSEKVVSIKENASYFNNLAFMNLLLTNACNLSCSYCYEQHNKDFGRFTTDTIRRAWDWLRDINDVDGKTLQFFGGEPLIHQKLILDFLREHKDEIVSRKNYMSISITTNGLLLTPEFLDEYFSYPNTKMMISLDTIDAAMDHREIGQEKIDAILTHVESIMKRLDNPTRFSIRATISQENAHGVRSLWDAMYARGVRQMVFHPLILSYSDGYREWSDDEWNAFTGDLQGIILEHPTDVRFIQIVEGVGFQRKTNCLTGSNTIAVDASGDFSGCYFFTNRKGSNTGDLLIGNIFQDELFIDRFEEFSRLYNEMFNTYDECKTCDLRGICYQCPAGNISTGEKLFRPDGMCQRLVKLHLSMKNLILQNLFRNKLQGMIEALRDQGESVYRKSLLHLLCRHFNGWYMDANAVDEWLAAHPQVTKENIAHYFIDKMKTFKRRELSLTLDDLSLALREYKNSASANELYFAALANLGIGHSIDVDALKGLPEDLLFVTLLHFVVANDTPAFGMGG
jgi:radical SAM protein with 4Fe4S-binding SPASM domain